MRTLANDHDRFQKTYFEHYKGYYFTGDGCRRDKDGYYWLTGFVSGLRLAVWGILGGNTCHPWDMWVSKHSSMQYDVM